jgi:hypothetical protein
MKLLYIVMTVFKYNHSHGMIKTFSPTTLVVRNAPILYRKDINMYSPTIFVKSATGMEKEKQINKNKSKKK